MLEHTADRKTTAATAAAMCANVCYIFRSQICLSRKRARERESGKTRSTACECELSSLARRMILDWIKKVFCNFYIVRLLLCKSYGDARWWRVNCFILLPVRLARARNVNTHVLYCYWSAIIPRPGRSNCNKRKTLSGLRSTVRPSIIIHQWFCLMRCDADARTSNKSYLCAWQSGSGLHTPPPPGLWLARLRACPKCINKT